MTPARDQASPVHDATFAGQFLSTADARRFILAGHAIVTLKSLATGKHFTYRIKRAPLQPVRPMEGVTYSKDPSYFVELLTGPDNSSDFKYMGTLRNGRYGHGRSDKACVSVASTAAQAFAWAWNRLVGDTMPDSLEVWHVGKCGRCGRRLTVPASIASGIGPDCAEKESNG